MNLLVLAQTPPPVHGQSVMVQTLVGGLPAEGIPVHHVNLRLARDTADIGRWRAGKIFAVLTACARAVIARFRYGCDTLYYVPAPGKRGALYRDWVVMLLCRPFFRQLVLHWHAAGLGEWLALRASAPERWLTQRLLGGASLSIVLSERLQADAESLLPRNIAVVPNGIDDPGEGAPARPSPTDGPYQVLFLGLCSEQKGLFAAANAVLAANRAAHGTEARPAFTLVAAGAFPDFTTGSRFRELCGAHPAILRYAGPVHGEDKTCLLRESHCLCLPTTYAAEGQPLVVLEALAHDLPVIATNWRALPEMITAATGRLVSLEDETALFTALLDLRKRPPATGCCRKRYLENYTRSHHLRALQAALLNVPETSLLPSA